jgi:hypothetical protein
MQRIRERAGEEGKSLYDPGYGKFVTCQKPNANLMVTILMMIKTYTYIKTSKTV